MFSFFFIVLHPQTVEVTTEGCAVVDLTTEPAVCGRRHLQPEYAMDGPRPAAVHVVVHTEPRAPTDDGGQVLLWQLALHTVQFHHLAQLAVSLGDLLL